MIDWEEVYHQLGFDSEGEMWTTLYLSNHLSINQLAALFHLSPTSICYRLHRCNIPLRPRGGDNNNQFTVERLNYIDPRVTWKSTTEELAMLFDVAPITIYKALRRLL